MQTRAKAVMFAPYTTNSELAKKLREAESSLEQLTGYKLKIVERAGSKLEDLLTRSNPWRGQDCGRSMCLLCQTKEVTGKLKTQDCSARNCVYEMWCRVCQEADEKKIDEEEKDEEEKDEEKIHL